MSTKIEWADNVYNPITGCTKISPSCDNCYAERMSHRLKGRFGYPKDDPFRVTFHPDKLEQPLKWKKPRTIFICSMGDIFHEEVQIDWIEKIFDVIFKTPQHTYLLLTKRPENIYLKTFPNEDIECLQNLWVGVTVENQEMADKRIPELIKQTSGKYELFVSCEPLLGSVDLSPWIDQIDWVIVGGETGTNARAINMYDFFSIDALCDKTRTPYFFKSWGKNWGSQTNLNAYGLRHTRRREFPDSLKTQG